jgi:hypothetical protein
MEAHLDDQQFAESSVQLEAILDSLYLIEFGQAVKRRAAGPFPTVIGTLDAIHLASVLLWEETAPTSAVFILTYYRQLALCAQALRVRITA